MIGKTNKQITLGGLVIALALSAMAATPAHAGLTNLPSPAKTESKMDWSDQTIRVNIDSTSTSSIDTQSLFASQTSETTTSTANIEMIPTTAHTAAEAPMPPAIISGSVMLILGAIAARMMKRKLAM